MFTTRKETRMVPVEDEHRIAICDGCGFEELADGMNVQSWLMIRHPLTKEERESGYWLSNERIYHDLDCLIADPHLRNF